MATPLRAGRLSGNYRLRTNKPSETPRPQPKPSLAELAGLDLGGAVTAVEGGNKGASNGSAVHPKYHHRRIEYYPVTSDELKQLATFNRVATISFSVGAFFTGISVDLFKDLWLAVGIPKEIISDVWTINISAAILAVSCFALGGVMLYINRGQTSNIINKSFSDN
jgi:hypothetical protein